MRIAAREDSRAKVSYYVPGDLPKYEAQQEAYKVMPDSALFVVQPVQIDICAEDRPGRPVRRMMCDRCGEGINDAREVQKGGQVVCRACANGRYYQPVGPLQEPDQRGSLNLIPDPEERLAREDRQPRRSQVLVSPLDPAGAPGEAGPQHGQRRLCG